MEENIKPQKPRPPIPEKIGPYKIENLFKVGGMSLLYLGIHPTTGKTVVIKVILPKFLKKKSAVSRLVREAKILGLANHPGIVKFYDIGQWEEGLFIAMEYIDGISLHSFLRRKSFTHKRALEIIIQVGYAIYHLHSQGVIHRDLKPSNILITENGEIKLIDFGISYFTESSKEDQITKTKAVMGTPRYMSPEQVESPELVSYSTDIFSLGMIAYELYLGRFSHGLIYFDILPKGLRKILKKALDIDPAKRYDDILSFINDLTQYLKLIGEEKESGEETPEEFIDLIESARAVLTCRLKPNLAEIEVGIAVKESIHPLYLDFFPFSQTKLGIVLAEPVQKGLELLTPLAVLRGMVRAAFLETCELIPFLEKLDKLLRDDPKGHKFLFSILILDSEQNLISYSGRAPLYHYPKGASQPRFLEIPNSPLLGEGTPFLELKENWGVGDTLLLSSAPLGGSLKNGALFLPAQAFAEKALESVPPTQDPSRGASLISFRRM